MKVRETIEGDYIVINPFDGKKLAGPFKKKSDAYIQMDQLEQGKISPEKDEKAK